ncbi:hypothetical protein, partial [Trebonia sp.]|uniref:hypothetical protein n=1 Tax=Trebonia sp. TaxID=2767075 RepID=UPI003BB2040F
EKDPASHTIAIEATGKETRGAGTASATVHASLKPDDAEGQTTVSIHTSLNVTGRPAQFGRSLLPEVSGKLIDQFAANLRALIDSTNRPAEAEPEAAPAQDAAAATGDAASTATAAGTAAATQTTATPAQPVAQLQQEDSLNLIKLVGGPVLKRVLPIVLGAALIAIFQRRIRGLFSRSKS